MDQMSRDKLARLEAQKSEQGQQGTGSDADVVPVNTLSQDLTEENDAAR
jgi:hypothetical protein